MRPRPERIPRIGERHPPTACGARQRRAPTIARCRAGRRAAASAVHGRARPRGRSTVSSAASDGRACAGSSTARSRSAAQPSPRCRAIRARISTSGRRNPSPNASQERMGDMRIVQPMRANPADREQRQPRIGVIGQARAAAGGRRRRGRAWAGDSHRSCRHRRESRYCKSIATKRLAVSPAARHSPRAPRPRDRASRRSARSRRRRPALAAMSTSASAAIRRAVCGDAEPRAIAASASGA